MFKEGQKQEINREDYLYHVDDLIKSSFKIDPLSILFGSTIVSVPFMIIYTNCISDKASDKVSDVVTAKVAKDTNKYFRNGNIIKAARKTTKNPPSADDLPLVDITNNRLVPSPIDQHSTYGSTY